MKNNINNINNGYLTGVGTLNAADIAVQEEGEGEREREGGEREREREKRRSKSIYSARTKTQYFQSAVQCIITSGS